MTAAFLSFSPSFFVFLYIYIKPSSFFKGLIDFWYDGVPGVYEFTYAWHKRIACLQWNYRAYGCIQWKRRLKKKRNVCNKNARDIRKVKWFLSFLQSIGSHNLHNRTQIQYEHACAHISFSFPGFSLTLAFQYASTRVRACVYVSVCLSLCVWKQRRKLQNLHNSTKSFYFVKIYLCIVYNWLHAQSAILDIIF